MISGIATYLIWRNLEFLSGLIWELLPALAVSALVTVIVSKLTPPPGPEVEAEFDLAANEQVPLGDDQGRVAHGF